MFACRACHAKAVTIDRVIELASDGDDELSLQTAACRACRAEYLAVYRESRRGALDRESWHHDAWAVASSVVRDAELAIAACPAPRDARCTCEAHRAYGNGGFRALLVDADWFALRA